MVVIHARVMALVAQTVQGDVKEHSPQRCDVSNTSSVCGSEGSFLVGSDWMELSLHSRRCMSLNTKRRETTASDFLDCDTIPSTFDCYS